MELIYLKYALIVLFILIIVLINTSIHLRVEFKRKKKDDLIKVKIALLNGLIKFNYEISYMDLVKRNKKIGYRVGEKNINNNLEKKENRFRPENIIESFNSLKKYFDVFREVIQYIIEKIKFDSLKLDSKFGIGDAALTGIAYGTLWTIIGVFLNALFSNKDIKNLSVNLYPDFNETILEIDFFCIIKLKIAHIIIAGVKGAKVLIKGGVLNGRSSYTRSNEDNNGKH